MGCVRAFSVSWDCSDPNEGDVARTLEGRLSREGEQCIVIPLVLEIVRGGKFSMTDAALCSAGACCDVAKQWLAGDS